MDLIEDFLLSGHCEDDVSLFEAVQCLITWETPATGKIVRRMTTLARSLAQKNGSYFPSGIIAAIWLLAKYSSRSDLMSLISSSTYVWEKSSWTARQIAAITPLLLEQDCLSITETVTRNGLLQALEVLAHIASLKRLSGLDKQLSSYLNYQPSKSWPYYSLPKVILALALLQGNLDLTQKTALRSNLLAKITDRRYKHLISQYP
ncbi:MAG: hypothetical protein AAF827_14370 [Cyanobacteria bacterium P01_D01_bin.6]